MVGRRRLLVGTFAGVLLALLPAPPAGAHGGATLTIHSDGHGSVWVTGVWQDGHAIVEPTPETLTANSSSSVIGPVSLTAAGDEHGTQVYGGTLPVGLWHVTVAAGPPVAGRCQATVPVGGPDAAPLPLEVACLVAATTPAPTPTPTVGVPGWLVGVTVLGVLVPLGILLLPRARRRWRTR